MISRIERQKFLIFSSLVKRLELNPFPKWQAYWNLNQDFSPTRKNISILEIFPVNLIPSIISFQDREKLVAPE